jgi:hypothetical protein
MFNCRELLNTSKMVSKLFEGLSRPAVSVKLDCGPIDSFLERLLLGMCACVEIPARSSVRRHRERETEQTFIQVGERKKARHRGPMHPHNTSNTIAWHAAAVKATDEQIQGLKDSNQKLEAEVDSLRKQVKANDMGMYTAVRHNTYAYLHVKMYTSETRTPP